MKKIIPKVLTQILLLLMINHAQATDLRVSANGHNLERRDGTPILLLSDTEWLLNTYNDAGVITILDNRKAKVFTAVQVFATRDWHKKDNEGNLPFIENNPTQLNKQYWQRWRWICDQAALRGLYFILVMGEPGRTGDKNVPWIVKSNSEAYEYSRQVGSFFIGAPNVIFAQGQDSQSNGSMMPYKGFCLDANGWRAMAEGTADGINGVNNFDHKADYTTTFMTYHGLEKTSEKYTDDISADFQHDEWLDFYGPEVWHDNDYVYEIINRDYNLNPPVKPSFLMEGTYENEPLKGDKTILTPSAYLRKEAWFSLFGGICGYAYGHCHNWDQTGNLDFLDSPGAMQMSVLADFAKKYHWWKWVPDNSSIISGVDSLSKRKVAVRSVNNEISVVYFPENSNATIRNILNAKASALWLDPRNGKKIKAAKFAQEQSRSLTPPKGWEDAVLVLTAD